MLAGSVVNIAAWPIFLLALFGAVRGKRLTYKVTPKGHNTEASRGVHEPLRLFLPHFIIGFLDVALLASSLITHRHALIMIFWASVSTILMLSLPFVQTAAKATLAAYRQGKAFAVAIGEFRLFGKRPLAEEHIRIDN